MTNFIFMLTHNDVTIPNAYEVFDRTKNIGVDYFGFKDVGLSFKKMQVLVNFMKEEKKKIVFEVVSENKKELAYAVKNALTLKADYLIGSRYFKESFQLLKDKIVFMPYIGNVVGHPCMLRGELEEIVADAKRTEKMGVSGVNLLAYRYNGDVDQLMESVKKAVKLPVVVAGSIDSYNKIRKVMKLGFWGFTIGGAIFEKKFVPEGDIEDQLKAVIKMMKNFQK